MTGVIRVNNSGFEVVFGGRTIPVLGEIRPGHAYIPWMTRRSNQPSISSRVHAAHNPWPRPGRFHASLNDKSLKSAIPQYSESKSAMWLMVRINEAVSGTFHLVSKATCHPLAVVSDNPRVDDDLRFSWQAFVPNPCNHQVFLISLPSTKGRSYLDIMLARENE